MSITKTLLFAGLILLFSSCATRIACVGDSITAGSGIHSESKDGYPTQLGRILGKNFQVLNAGRSGATLQQKGDLPYWNCNQFSNVFAFRPNTIVIKLGTNDTKPQNWTLGDFEKDYQALIDTFRTISPKPKILLCKPVPVFETRWGINDSTLVNGVIPAVEKLALKNNLEIIDLNKGMLDKGSEFPDNIHPNVAGAVHMAEIVADAIQKK